MAYLYKYVTADTGKIILKTNTLRWSTPPTLNDPFDMQFAFQLRCDLEKVRVMANEKHWQLYSMESVGRPLNVAGKLLRYLRENAAPMSREEYDDGLSGVIDECIQSTESSLPKHSDILLKLFSNDKIFCMSEAPNIILLWSHYALNHSGLVLRFTDRVPNGATKMARPVRYVEHFPSLVDDETFSDMLAGYDVLDRQKILDDIVYTKSSHWAYEREWRIHSGNGRSDAAFEDIPFIPEELDGVIFGLRTSTDDRDDIGSLVRAKYPHVELLQAVPEPSRYALTIKPAS